MAATHGRMQSAHQWDTKLVHEEDKFSSETRWWKPFSKQVISRNRLAVQAGGQGQGSNTVTYFGLQFDKRSWELIEHNMWFYYYCITGMLGSIYGFILAVNLCNLIPYRLIAFLFLLVSAAIFAITFVGLMVLCIAVAKLTDSTIPPRQLNSGEQFCVIFTVCASFILIMVGISILTQFEALSSRPLVMVGIVLTGIDLIIFSVFLVFSCLPQNKLIVAR